MAVCEIVRADPVIKLTLSKEEAMFLKNAMQNPITIKVTDFDYEESPNEARYRQSIFVALNTILQQEK